ncbi:MAG: antitoxin YezG family protein [Spirochaetia bacterium]|nr:antitoxin YezG family protein [Spirochaetia bacterium]
MENIYEEIAKNLVTVLPENWEKVCLYCQLTKNSYEFFFYVKVDGNYIQNFDLEKSYKITRKEIRDCFKNLNTILRPDYEAKSYYVMTFILANNGKFTTEYEYKDYSEKSLEYKKTWKEKYLK